MKYIVIALVSAALANGNQSSLRTRAQPYLESALAAGDAFVNISSASGLPNISADSLVTAFGDNLALRTESAPPPYAMNLGGITLNVVDSNHAVRYARLLYASPTRVDYLMPPGTAPGTATIHIDREVCAAALPNVFPTEPCGVSSTAQIQNVAPALFTANANGRGVVIAAAYRSILGSGGLVAGSVPVYECGTRAGSCVSLPINLGLDTPVLVMFYATGLRGRSSDSALKLTIGGQVISNRRVQFQDDSELTCGPVRQICAAAGVDLVFATLPLSLRGRGEVDVVISSDGRTSNAGRIRIGDN